MTFSRIDCGSYEPPSTAGTDEFISLTKPLNPREWGTNSRNCYGCRFHKVDSRRCLSGPTYEIAMRAPDARTADRQAVRTGESRNEKGRALKTLTKLLNIRARGRVDPFYIREMGSRWRGRNEPEEQEDRNKYRGSGKHDRKERMQEEEIEIRRTIRKN